VTAPLRVALHGADGRMGRAILRAMVDTKGFNLVAAIDRNATARGADAGERAGVGHIGVQLTGEMAAVASADVVIDFSHRDATLEVATACAAARRPLVVGTTGLTPETIAALDELAKKTRMVVAPNTSIGVTVLFHLAKEATRLLGEDFDAEIVEVHHNKKADAPSGTALRLAEAVAEGKGLGAESFVHGRTGMVGARPKQEIGIHAVRAGDVIGEHTLYLAGPAERLELVHRAHDRALFARGALRAARWVASGGANGRFDMRDVLGLR
jgi:4-hydroxy-tetrahydrodipicolinate reductase